MTREQYTTLKLKDLKIRGKNMGLLNVDKYKKGEESKLIDRLLKGKQLSDESKPTLLEKARNEGLLVNATMSKEEILEKINKPKLTDLGDARLREIAKDRGIKLKDYMPKKQIIERLKNPLPFYDTKRSIGELAKKHNITIPKGSTKPQIIKILQEEEIIPKTPKPITKPNLAVEFSNVPLKLIRAVTKKARNAREALANYKEYV